MAVPRDSWTKDATLAELIAAERTLLVLDGLEPLQQPPGGFGGEFNDPAMTALVRGLAQQNRGLCVLTSRTDITALSAFEHACGSRRRHRLESLDPTSARGLLRDLLRELQGVGPDQELDEAIAWFHRHAYDLNLLGNYLWKCTIDHDIRGWRERLPILREDERIRPLADATSKRAGHGRRMLRAYERWLNSAVVESLRDSALSCGATRPHDLPPSRVDSPAVAVLRLMGLFDRPARADLLDVMRADPLLPGLTESLVSLSNDDWLATLSQLEDLSQIRREPAASPPNVLASRRASAQWHLYQ